MGAIGHHSGLDRAATDWVVRLTSGAAGGDDVAAARAWCAQSPQHRAAFERARELWRDAGRVPVRQRTSAPRKLAYAASLLLTLSAGWLVARADWFVDYRAPSNAPQRIGLADGSTVLLDRGSAIDVSYDEYSRDLHLWHGQALFEVRHDPARPFVVRGTSFSATALGTVYAVRSDDDAQEVTVKQGVVEVRAASGEVARVAAGEHLVFRAHETALKPEPVDLNTHLAWERGVLVFKQAPLAEVVRQLNRYRRGYVLVAGASLNDLPVSGVFRLDDLDDALATLPSALPVKITRLTNYLVVLH